MASSAVAELVAGQLGVAGGDGRLSGAHRGGVGTLSALSRDQHLGAQPVVREPVHASGVGSNGLRRLACPGQPLSTGCHGVLQRGHALQALLLRLVELGILFGNGVELPQSGVPAAEVGFRLDLRGVQALLSLGQRGQIRSGGLGAEP